MTKGCGLKWAEDIKFADVTHCHSLQDMMDGLAYFFKNVLQGKNTKLVEKLIHLTFKIV